MSKLDDALAGAGVTLLRVALGLMFFSHGFLLKYLTFTPAGTAQFFGSIGLPPALAYLTIAAETLGGILLVLGVQTRWVAAALAPILAGAVWVHSGNGWVFTAANGGWEYPLYLLVLAVAQMLLGDGRYALSPSRLPSTSAAVRVAAE